LQLMGVAGPRELVGKTVVELTATSPDGGDALLDAHRRALDGESADITEQWGALHFDLHLEPLYEDDRIVGVGGIAVDASKRRIAEQALVESEARDRKSTRLNSSHRTISYAVFCLKKKKKKHNKQIAQ